MNIGFPPKYLQLMRWLMELHDCKQICTRRMLLNVEKHVSRYVEWHVRTMLNKILHRAKKSIELWNYIDSRHCWPLSYLRPAYILRFETARDDRILEEREQSLIQIEFIVRFGHSRFTMARSFIYSFFFYTICVIANRTFSFIASSLLTIY